MPTSVMICVSSPEPRPTSFDEWRGKSGGTRGMSLHSTWTLKQVQVPSAGEGDDTVRHSASLRCFGSRADELM